MVRILENEIYDITIVGAGPVGLFTATYALMRQAKTQVIESLSEVGGQVIALFPAKQIYDVPGYFKISGTDLISNLKEQTDFFKPEIHLNETVEKFEKDDDGIFHIQTNKRTTLSRSIILATGVGAFEPRKLKVENAADFENTSLFYSVPDILMFKDKNVVIAGGGDSAADWTIELSKVAKKVTLVHRRDQFRALESSISKIKELANVEILTPYMIDGLEHQGNQTQIRLKRSRTKDEYQTLLADALIVNYGFKTDTSVQKKWNLETAHNQIKVDSTQQTSIKGVYAIGDNAYQEGCVDLIACGFGQAPVAINHALETIYPEKRQPTHSTQLMKNFNVE